ncbi:caspase family protein [Sporosalibacterium faouarense]|uniref:caspase family protein n=1 Tax=Sporosalibacterium faouarense TaxID=516123 RepID=UPI00192C3CCF|nr:caspase family protein [Sporosalibacterium faouarense]
MTKHGVALVVYNSEYEDSGIRDIPSCKKDGEDVKKVLSEIGFDVIEACNLGRRELLERMQDYFELLDLYETNLFYYSGHGVQVEGINYIVPSDTAMANNKMLMTRVSFVEIDLIAQEFAKRPEKTNLILLDACRDNPFLSKGLITTGLAEMKAGAGTLISYATSPDSTSIGYGSETVNSLYTKYLMKYIKTPNLKIEDMFKLIRIKVEDKTAGNQVPWENTSLKGNFSFVNKKEEEISLDIYSRVRASADLSKTLIDLSNAYMLPIVDVLLKYYSYKMNLPGAIYLTLSECYGLCLKQVLDNGFTLKNYRWYYDDKPVVMGEFLFDVLPEGIHTIDISINHKLFLNSNRDLSVIIEINVPNGMKFGCTLQSLNKTSNPTVFSEVDSKQLIFDFSLTDDWKSFEGEVVIHLFSIVNSLQPLRVKEVIGDNGENMRGDCVKFDSISQYNIDSKMNLYVLNR